MSVINDILTTKFACYRQFVLLGKVDNVICRLMRPPAAAENDLRSIRIAKQFRPYCDRIPPQRVTVDSTDNNEAHATLTSDTVSSSRSAKMDARTWSIIRL
jgi:hypothetical protein